MADKMLPGLTNVASRPRYFALLCAGIQLSGDQDNRSEREQILHRQETILRLERFWALANVLARPEESGGVRGVTYAQAWAEEIQRLGSRSDQSELSNFSPVRASMGPSASMRQRCQRNALF